MFVALPLEGFAIFQKKLNHSALSLGEIQFVTIGLSRVLVFSLAVKHSSFWYVFSVIYIGHIGR